MKWLAGCTDLVLMAEECIHKTKVTKVYWFKPPTSQLNSDGSAFANSGKLGARGIIRYFNGDCLFAYSASIREGTNNQAASAFVISSCLQLGYRKVIWEVDSELLTKQIGHQFYPPWSIYQSLIKLHNYINQLQNIRCTHIHREVNFVIDTLAKHRYKFTSPQLYFNNQQVSSVVKAYYQLENTRTSQLQKK